MARFTIEFEDNNNGGAKARFDLEGFEGAEGKPFEERTFAQNLYFLIAETIRNDTGLKIPKIDKGESNER